MQRLGFFKELRHGHPDGPAFDKVRGGFADDHKAEVVDYLRDGTVLAASGELALDRFDDANASIGQLNILTDGEWVWPSDLPYYLDKYDVALPDDFLVHVASRGWSARPVSHDELVRVEEDLLS